MASKLDADLTNKVGSCPKHSDFTLDFVCRPCRKSVCARCIVLEHHGHDFENVKNLKKDILELRENLKVRKRDVKRMKKDCQEMLGKVHEITDEKLFSIERERERRRSSVELDRNDFERRVKGITDCLEKEENKIYALEYSSEAALSAKVKGGGENFLDDIQEELGKCTNAQLPRVKTYENLKVKFNRLQSANRFSSSSMVTVEELETTSFAATTCTFHSDDSLTSELHVQPVQVCRSLEVQVACSSRSKVVEPCTSPSEVIEPETPRGSSSEEAQAIESSSEDESGDAGIEADMDTYTNSDCERKGAAGGETFERGRGRVGEREKCSQTKSGKDSDVVLYDLTEHLHPYDITPVGVRLGVSYTVMEQIEHNNPGNIRKAIFQVLQEWKKALSVEVLTEDHFRTLERCLREIKNEDAADWLIERLQKSAGQPLQSPSSPDQLVEPSTSHLGQPSSSDLQ